jgi:hypothetical protein
MYVACWCKLRKNCDMKRKILNQKSKTIHLIYYVTFFLDKKSNQKNQEPMISNTSVHFVLFSFCTIAFRTIDR